MLLNIKCLFWFSLLSWAKSYIVRSFERDIIINEHTSSCKVTVIVVWFALKLKLNNRFMTNSEEIILKICPLGAELFHADERTVGQTNRTNCIVAFRKLAKANKSQYKTTYICRTPPFLIYYIYHSFVFWNLLSFQCKHIFFAELGRLYRYESSSDGLLPFHYWRSSDLLVRRSADTTRKRSKIVVIVVDAVKALLS
jgi:hypothetical protein